MTRTLLIVFLFILLSQPTYSQVQGDYYRDQLIDNYESAATTQERYINGVILTIDIQLNSKEKAKEYVDQLQDIEIKNKSGIQLSRAYNLYHSRSYVKSKEMLDRSLKKLADLDSPLLLGQAYFLEGLLYAKNDLHRDAMNSYNTSEAYFQSVQYIRGLADVASGKGMISQNRKNDEETLAYFSDAKKRYLEIGATDMAAMRTVNQSRNPIRNNDTDKAIEYYLEALGYLDKSPVNTKKLESNIVTKLVNLYEEKEDHETSKLYKDRLLVLTQELENTADDNELIVQGYFTSRNNQRSINKSTIIASQWEAEKSTLELKNEKIKRELSDAKANLWTALASGAFLLLLLGAYNYRRIKTKNKLIQEQKSTIEKALKEKDILLREIHHRVKNNLQVVSSLLGIQGRGIKDQKAKEAIQEGRNRVQSMSLIHQNLYKKENLTGIEMKPYISKLSNHLLQTYQIDSGVISINSQIDDITLDVETVVPIGLIINELMSNALKYAFPDNSNGIIEINLQEKDDTLILSVADNGIGLNPEQLQSKTDSFGHSLIRAFRSKLNAEVDIIGHPGTTVTMKIKNYKKV